MNSESASRFLTVSFTGVNGYYFEEGMLKVVFPNATRLGRSAQLDLAPHFPTICGYVGQELTFVEYFHWHRLEIGASYEGQSVSYQGRSPVTSGPGKVLTIDASMVTAQPPSDLVSAQVWVKAGQVQTAAGPCKNTTISYGDGSLDDSGLLHQVDVQIDHTELHLDLFDLLSQGAATPLELPPKLTAVVVGNLCPGDILAWPTNDSVGSKPDPDFRWMSQLTGGAVPVPMISSGQCGVSPDQAIDDELRNSVLDRLAKVTGGGVCGCQCVGCVVEPR